MGINKNRTINFFCILINTYYDYSFFTKYDNIQKLNMLKQAFNEIAEIINSYVTHKDKHNPNFNTLIEKRINNVSQIKTRIQNSDFEKYLSENDPDYNKGDNDMEHPIGNLMNVTMDKIKEMVDVNTIVGTPITAEDGTLIIPVSKVSYGFASGGSDLPTKTSKQVFGGGGGAAVHGVQGDESQLIACGGTQMGSVVHGSFDGIHIACQVDGSGGLQVGAVLSLTGGHIDIAILQLIHSFANSILRNCGNLCVPLSDCAAPCDHAVVFAQLILRSNRSGHIADNSALVIKLDLGLDGVNHAGGDLAVLLGQHGDVCIQLGIACSFCGGGGAAGGGDSADCLGTDEDRGELYC